MKLEPTSLVFATLGFISAGALTGCAPDPSYVPGSQTGAAANPAMNADKQIAITLNSARVSFQNNDYYSLAAPNANHCAGDARTYYDPVTLKPFPASAVDPTQTVHPAFIKNVSVDLTDANQTDATNLAFSCSYGSNANVPPPSSCASFDLGTLLGGTITQGYGTGYYTLNDFACAQAGPINSTDPTTKKLLAGGAYFDLDRTALGPNENLLMNVTLVPLGPGNQRPDGSAVPTSESAVFRVHLIKTGLPVATLQTGLQPRYLTYSDPQQFPETAPNIALLAPPTGQIRQEQVLIPLGLDPGIDRVRIERYSGSGILIEASLYRMGQK